MQLFEADALSWSKIASVELEEDATQWPRQVLTELFRALPEISEYTPEVKFLKTNEEQGYAVGVVVVSNGTNSALATQQSGVEAPKALIPIVIKGGKLEPLDTVMSSSGKMFPLTVDRLREVLYRPETFDLITDDWGDAGLWQLFAPPGQGLGGGQGPGSPTILTGPGMKQAAANDNGLTLLERIDGTILEPDLADFTQALANDPVMLKAAAFNPAMREVLGVLAETVPVGGDVEGAYKIALDQNFPADVVLMRYEEEGDCYEVKLANRALGRETHDYMDRRDFLAFVGDKVAADVDQGGPAVAARNAGARVLVGVGGDTVRPINQGGYYTVYNATTGAHHEGWVATPLIDVTGTKVPLALFCNEDGATTQESIAGNSNYGRPTVGLPNDPPRGQGCFVVSSSNYALNATVPLTVRGSTGDNGSIRYNCVDLMGTELTVVLQRGVQAMVAFPERKELLLPYNTHFISTERGFPLLVSRGEEEAKTASMLLEPRMVVRGVEDDYERQYQLELHNLPKLASLLDGRQMGPDHALYTLCLAGLSGEEAVYALSKVALHGSCEIACEDVGNLPTTDLSVHKIASEEVRGLRQRLMKEASVMPDTMTVDAVLSLDFINSENVRCFISMIPYLEKALNKICELTFAARLGLNEIPEAAAARAARGLNDAIRGLKALALRQVEELP